MWWLSIYTVIFLIFSRSVRKPCPLRETTTFKCTTYLWIYSPRHKIRQAPLRPNFSSLFANFFGCITCNLMVNIVNNTTKTQSFQECQNTWAFPMRCSGIFRRLLFFGFILNWCTWITTALISFTNFSKGITIYVCTHNIITMWVVTKCPFISFKFFIAVFNWFCNF